MFGSPAAPFKVSFPVELLLEIFIYPTLTGSKTLNERFES
ncbi:hypothetical protein [Metabacillus rhizolycopersici]